MGRGGAGLIHQGQLSWLQLQAYSFQHCTFKSPTCTHTCTVLQLDKVELGWVGVLWLNAFPVMLHRQASGLLSHYWLSLSLHLCLGTFFFSPLTALLQGTWVQMLWRGIWTTFWWWGMGPSGTVKPRWKGSGWGLQNILVQWWITYFHMKSRLNGSRIFEDTRFCKRIQMQR